jgi:hypothetical protein
MKKPPGQRRRGEDDQGVTHMTAITSYHDNAPLTLLFCVDQREQAEALHAFRAAFGKQTHIEAVNESVYALHIWPGHPGCPCDGGARRQAT